MECKTYRDAPALYTLDRGCTLFALYAPDLRMLCRGFTPDELHAVTRIDASWHLEGVKRIEHSKKSQLKHYVLFKTCSIDGKYIISVTENSRATRFWGFAEQARKCSSHKSILLKREFFRLETIRRV